MTSSIEYLGFRALAALVSHAPYRWVGAMGSLLGLTVMYVTGYRRKVTMDNLRRAFPGKPQDELDAIARGSYRNYGRAILEMLWAGGQPADVLKARIHPRNMEVLREALAGGHGTILMSAHFGSWEFLLTGLKLHIPEPFVAIAQRQRNERIDAMIDERRSRFDVKTVPMGPSVREVLRALGEGKVIIILGDQSGPRESVFIPFFGRPSATHRGAAAFALRAHAPIVLVLLMRREDGEYDAVFERIDTSGLSGDREAQIVELTARHAAVLERYIRERPDHWLWMHKRWKHTPEFEARMNETAVPAELPVNGAQRFLVFHTAFIGDLVLTLPVTQALRAAYPDAWIGVVAIPAAGALVHGHPSIDEVIVYDKKGSDRGLVGFFTLVARMRALHAGTAIVPHRSLRSALAVWLAGIPRRIGFTTSAGAMLLTVRVPYDPAAHEVDRNLALVRAIGVDAPGARRPLLPPSPEDAAAVDRTLQRLGGGAGGARLVALAPGSVWFTKRWPARHFAALADGLSRAGRQVVLVGGKEDRPLCDRIAAGCGEGVPVRNTAGELTLRQSAELLRRCELVITNDSAPLHLAGAVGTTTFAVFGATVPAFGFGPLGPSDRTFGMDGLSCRPCAIHGGNRCPIGTFDCLERLAPDEVLQAALDLLQDHTEAH